MSTDGQTEAAECGSAAFRPSLPFPASGSCLKIGCEWGASWGWGGGGSVGVAYGMLAGDESIAFHLGRLVFGGVQSDLWAESFQLLEGVDLPIEYDVRYG